MSSINQYIDDAVTLAKQRAAEFDDVYEMTEADTPISLTSRAFQNVDAALYEMEEVDDPDGDYIIESLCDAINLCALALGTLDQLG